MTQTQVLSQMVLTVVGRVVRSIHVLTTVYTLVLQTVRGWPTEWNSKTHSLSEKRFALQLLPTYVQEAVNWLCSSRFVNRSAILCGHHRISLSVTTSDRVTSLTAMAIRG